jgi:hypothetical protein
MKNAIRLVTFFAFLGLLLASVLWAQQGGTQPQASETQGTAGTNPQAGTAKPACCAAMAPAAAHGQAGGPAAKSEHHGAEHGATQHQAGKMGHCPQMQGMHEQKMADMKAMDARLDEKLAAMNAAKGDAKIDAMAAVITELASQRKAMQQKMASHHGERGHKMGHQGMKSEDDCPMMQMKHEGSHEPAKKESTTQ